MLKKDPFRILYQYYWKGKVNQDIIARGKKETSGKYRCWGSLRKLYMLGKEWRAAPVWKSRLPWSPSPHILVLPNFRFMAGTSWEKEGDGSEWKETLPCQSHTALPVLLRNLSAPPYSIWPCFLPPQARCPRMSTWGSEEPRHGCVLHKWGNFCQSIAGVKQHLSQDEVMITQMRTAQLPHSSAPNTMPFSLPSGSAPLCNIY